MLEFVAWPHHTVWQCLCYISCGSDFSNVVGNNTYTYHINCWWTVSSLIHAKCLLSTLCSIYYRFINWERNEKARWDMANWLSVQEIQGDSEKSLTLQKVVLNCKQQDPERILKDLWRRSWGAIESYPMRCGRVNLAEGEWPEKLGLLRHGNRCDCTSVSGADKRFL